MIAHNITINLLLLKNFDNLNTSINQLFYLLPIILYYYLNEIKHEHKEYETKFICEF
ncbi:hypothetical protein SCO01_06920 [Staphylococcus cohnii subsp. cohnii]|nr:hypothetical protein SCO01_06920 [Staphylococcus cohnii subsp. cohnii]